MALEPLDIMQVKFSVIPQFSMQYGFTSTLMTISFAIAIFPKVASKPISQEVIFIIEMKIYCHSPLPHAVNVAGITYLYITIVILLC